MTTKPHKHKWVLEAEPFTVSKVKVIKGKKFRLVQESCTCAPKQREVKNG